MLNISYTERGIRDGCKNNYIDWIFRFRKDYILKKLLKKYSDKKIGVIINDFGKIGVDVELIDRDGIKMSSINSGSIFCSCKSDQFIKAMMEVIKENVDTILVESSGPGKSINTTENTGDNKK